MTWKIGPQWHLIAWVAVVVVCALRAPATLAARSLLQESATVMGRIESVERSRRISVVGYSYEVAGARYTGQSYARDRTVTGVPVQVTYSPGNPSQSTIEPEGLPGQLRIGLILCGSVLLIALAMTGYEVFGKRNTPPAPAAEPGPGADG